QLAISNATSFQIEVSQDEVDKGDVAQRLLPSLLVDSNLRVNTEIMNYRIGVNHAISPQTLVLFNTRNTEIDDTLQTSASDGTGTLRKIDTKLNIHDLQILHDGVSHRFIGGINYNRDNQNSAITFDFSPLPCLLPFPDCTSRVNFTEKQIRLYGYYFYQPSKMLQLTTGLSAARSNSEIFSEEETTILPKLGAQWSVTEKSKIYAAAFRT
ncbi:MAG: hypothetical protein AB2690_22070, partial [Candidatus Thiodiazotropha endolucinida]